jgi:flagellar basal-body rod modification protein FlgD
VLGKDEFLKLFITQLRQQDPLNPMNGEQFAAQLAQFSSVEQLHNIAQQLAGQAQLGQAIAAAINNSNAIGAIGKTVTALGDMVVVDEHGKGNVAVDVGGSGGAATLTIQDASGRTVGSRSLGNIPAGRSTFELGSAADGLAPGPYTYSITVTDESGKSVPVQTYTVARVDGVGYGPDGPVLHAGPLAIPLISVVEIAAGN